MSAPVLSIATMRIHDGQLEHFKESVRKSVAFVETNGPHLMAQVYIDEANMLAYSFQVQPDSEAILSHWGQTDPYIRAVNEYMTPERVDFYGQPSDAVMDGLRQA